MTAEEEEEESVVWLGFGCVRGNRRGGGFFRHLFLFFLSLCFQEENGPEGFGLCLSSSFFLVPKY